MDLQEKFEQGCAGLILVEPGHSHVIGKFRVRQQATDDQGDQVGFPAAARANEKQMVLVLGKRTLPHPFHGVLQELVTLNEDELQILGIGAARGEYPDALLVVHFYRPRLIFHQRRIRGNRKRKQPS